MQALLRAGTVLYQRPGQVKISKLSKNTVCPILAEFSDWVQVGDRLWASTSDILEKYDDYSSPPGEPPPPSSNYATIKAGSVLYQRIGGIKILKLKKAAIYPVYSTVGDWVQVGDKLWVVASQVIYSSTDPEPQPEPPPETVPPPADTSNLWCVEHDGVPRFAGGHSGLPETHKCLEDWKPAVNEYMMRYITRLLQLLHPEMTDSEVRTGMSGLYRNNAGFSNQTGIDSGNFRIQNLYCGGATFRAVTGDVVAKADKLWMEVYALDPADMPPLPTRLADIDMTKHFFPCTASAVPYLETYRANPFPNFGGRCIIPFFGKGGTNFVQSDQLVKVETINNPFYPARADVTQGLI